MFAVFTQNNTKRPTTSKRRQLLTTNCHQAVVTRLKSNSTKKTHIHISKVKLSQERALVRNRE